MWRAAAALLLLALLASGHDDLYQPPANNCDPLPHARRVTQLVVREGQRAALQCGLDARRATTTWTHLDTSRLLTMTINSYVHLNEPRYRLVNISSPVPQWVLLIEQARPSDAGLYRCSVMYERANRASPASRLVRLTVVSPLRTIIGGPHSRHVHSGQQLRISCSANVTDHQAVTWTLNGAVVVADGVRVTLADSPVCSLLVVSDISQRDRGMYGCHVPGLQSDSLQVKVVSPGDGNTTRNRAPSSMGNGITLRTLSYVLLIVAVFSHFVTPP